jgi:putative hydrolase of the HAD superfamily
MNREIKAILFDLGSTLLEYEKFDWETIGRVGNAAGYEFLKKQDFEVPPAEVVAGKLAEIFQLWKSERDDDFLEINFHELVTEAFEQMNLPTDYGLVRDFIQAFYQPVSDHVESLDGSEETVRELKSMGLKIVIVSNSIFPAYLHLQELERFGILPHIDGMVFSCDLGVKKPHPDIYIHALEIAGCTPDEAVFVGDRYLEDLEGPAGLGIPAVLRRKEGREYPPEISNFPACDSLSELFDILGIGVDRV